MNAVSRALLLYLGLVVFIVLVGLWQGVANISLLMLQASAFALVALGLNIQFGYGGLFNFGIMGMMMIGGFAVTFVSYPVNMKFWQSDGPLLLLALIGRHGPTRGTSLLFLVPSFTAFLGWLLLGQPVGAVAVLGLGVAGLGLWLGRRPAPRVVSVPLPVAAGVRAPTERELCGST